MKSIQLSQRGRMCPATVPMAALLVGGGLISACSIEAAEQTSNRFPRFEESLAAAVPNQPPQASNPTLSVEEFSLVGNEIEDLDRIASDYARSVALRRLLNRTDEQQILDLLEQASGISNPSRKLDTQTEIYRRLAQLNPLKALTHTSSVSWRRRAPLVEAIFLEWALTDFETAIEKAATLGPYEQRNALKAILETRSDWSEDETIALAQDFGLTELAYQLRDESYLALAIEDPASAWEAATNDSRNDRLQYQSLAEILELWRLRDGEHVLLQVQDVLAQMSYYGESIVYRTISELASRDPEASLRLARSLQKNLREHAIKCVISEWAGNDPRAALQAVTSMEHGILRNYLGRTIASGWAEKDPHELLHNLSILPSEAQEQAQLDAVSSIAARAPEEAAELLTEIPNGIKKHGWIVASDWSRKDVRGALDWVLSLDESHQENTLTWIWFELVEEDHELAFEVALNQPVPAYRRAHEVRVIELLAENDLEKAINLLPRVRDHPGTKESAYATVASALVEQGESDRAIELGQELPESLREYYHLSLFSKWARWDIVNLYESLDEFPSTQLKSRAARAILSYWDLSRTTVHHFFSDQQIQEIREHLAEDASL